MGGRECFDCPVECCVLYWKALDAVPAGEGPNEGDKIWEMEDAEDGGVEDEVVYGWGEDDEVDLYPGDGWDSPGREMVV